MLCTPRFAQSFSISRAPEPPGYWLGEIYIGIFVLIFHKFKNLDQILTLKEYKRSGRLPIHHDDHADCFISWNNLAGLRTAAWIFLAMLVDSAGKLAANNTDKRGSSGCWCYLSTFFWATRLAQENGEGEKFGASFFHAAWNEYHIIVFSIEQLMESRTLARCKKTSFKYQVFRTSGTSVLSPWQLQVSTEEHKQRIP